jgi:hypothetical protein
MAKVPYPIRMEQKLIERIHVFAEHQDISSNSFIIRALKKATSGRLPVIEKEDDSEFAPHESDNPVFIKDSDRT